MVYSHTAPIPSCFTRSTHYHGTSTSNVNTVNKMFRRASRIAVRVMSRMQLASDSPNCWGYSRQDSRWNTCKYCLHVPANWRSDWAPLKEKCYGGWDVIQAAVNFMDNGNMGTDYRPIWTAGDGNEWRLSQPFGCSSSGRNQLRSGGKKILDHMQKGLYKPKNFTEEEMSCGLLFLRLGGARVASLTHQALGSPGLSTLHCGSAVIPLSPLAGIPSRVEIQRNLQAAFKTSHGDNGCGYVLMIDEIKVEEWMRWDPSSNKILGLCHEHTKHVGLDFCSVNDAKALIEGILCGDIHHATEVGPDQCHFTHNKVMWWLI